MLTVYKYMLRILEFQAMFMHGGARILHVDTQNGVPCLWALVDTTLPMVERRFRILTTGAPLLDVKSEQYIGTFMLHDGTFVGHIFEASF